ncbi:MAG TPA: SUMF1/EgtB/PvdO family nonheme iron enzyme [Polyangiaceae bacterium]|nr:SUMF1/EgtB/PvdO family nonheme iron enzyme [Polyangiaceae bacterium]
MSFRGATASAALLVLCTCRPAAVSKPGGPCLEGMTLVDGRFCIDRWEASLVEVTPEGDRPFSPYETPNKARVRAVSAAGVVPQGYVSREDAEHACAEAGKRLCKEDEWAAACRGSPPTAFPYGDRRSKGACNDSGASPLHVFYPEAPETYRSGPMNDPRLNRQPNTVAKTGEFSRCESSWGAFDMVGNLHEWVMSPRPTFRGGYYLDTHLNGDGCAYRTTAHGAFYHDYSTGFRCCADPR